MTLGQRIQKGRKEAGLSQEELAEQLGVSRQAVSRWENDNGYPEIEKIIRLSQIYQVSLDYLVGNEQENRERIYQKKVGMSVMSWQKAFWHIKNQSL